MRFPLCFVLLLYALVVCAPGAFAKPPAGAPKSDLVNDAAIRKLYTEFEAAWNRHDVPALAKMWALDADHVEPDGHEAKGRAQVENLLLKQHASVFNATQLTLNIDEIWFITADVALVDGTYNVTGIRDPKGNEVGARNGKLTAVFLKEDGRWWIAADRLMIPAPLPWRKD